MAEDPAQQDNPEADRPEWLPENFKTPEDLASSYRESQRKITEETTARRNLEQLVASQQAQIEQIQAAQAQPEPDQNDWYQAYEQDPIATQRALAEQAARDAVAAYAQQAQPQTQQVQGSQAEIVASLAYNALEDRYGKLTDEQRNEMARVATERPYLIPADAVASPQKLADALDVVYQLAVPNPSPATSQEDLMRTMKLQAQSANGAGGHLSPADEAQQRWQEITNASTGKLGL
jgi:hypothetical protein